MSDSDNKKPIWFRRKTYGWGWTPATWQGWTIMVVWIALFSAGGIIFNKSMERSPSWETTILFLLYLIFLICALIRISYKYGESPRWQWGEKKDLSKK